jgi:hypothetical protein
LPAKRKLVLIQRKNWLARNLLKKIADVNKLWLDSGPVPQATN